MNPTSHFKQFGKYEIVKKLGRSMTDVYLAFDPEANRRVVLKIIEHSHDPYTQVVMEAERRGATIQSQLHSLDPRILEIYDYGEMSNCFYVVMEYVEGKNLTDILRTEHRLDPRRAARYAGEVCNQLETLHSYQADIDGRKRAVVHGDIKPCNIQIGLKDDVRLLDFGIAKAITSTHNLTHHNLGSPAYCSPERVKSTNVDQHVDLWALGVTLYEMVAGMPPYQAQNTRKLENLIQSRRPPRALPQDCPPALKAIIGKALAASLDRRYATAAAFENDLRAFMQNQPTVAEAQHEPAWESNETLETNPAAPAESWMRTQVFEKRLAEATRMLWILAAGFVFGLLLFIPAGYIYKLWGESATLRSPRGYIHRDVADIGADWKLYQSLKQHANFLGRYSPAEPARASLHADLVTTANQIIDGYRNSSDPELKNFDWNKARVCLRHALELDPADRESKGKLALCDGFSQLAQNPAAATVSFKHALEFIPASPDPHLGLARLYVYTQHNAGRAIAEFHEAERHGFHLGPREIEQQGDAYLYRAEQELKTSKTARADRARYLSLAQRDLDRARNLYEPIDGFSKVSENLQQIARDEIQQHQLQALASNTKPKYKKTRYRSWR